MTLPSVEKANTRLLAIDALRGLVMVFMLVDHVRETFFLHLQVSDPVDASTADPALFFTRLLSTFCAPVFVALTGLSAWLYGQSHTKREISVFLLKRGLFLVFLEITFVSFAWSAQFPPQTIWLQVIWAIGISMIMLAALLHLPRTGQLILGIIIVCGHNLLDDIIIAPDSPLYISWAMLHQRAAIELSSGLIIKTTYPVLPWIGVILLGYAMGPWFAHGTEPLGRIRHLWIVGGMMLITFAAVRYLNFYGDKPWFVAESSLRTVMSFLALTKYPPSLLFLLPTLGTGLLLLALFERMRPHFILHQLAFLGGAPMFFYLLHLYVLKVLYLTALALYGPTQGQYFSVDHILTVWLWAVILLPLLYFPTRWFARMKQNQKDMAWMKYL